MTAPKILYEHRKTGGRLFRASIGEYNGSTFADFREWVEKDGEIVATQKGATLPPECIRELVAALMAVIGS